jgi:hypothetical protein
MDAFDLLELPRRPWLEPNDVRSAFQRRARKLHPDSAAGDGEAFVRLNAAYRELERPARRLRQLLGGHAIPSAPPDVALGFEIGAALRESGLLLDRWRQAAAPLGRALMAEEISIARSRLHALANQVTARIADAETRLRSLDAAWPDVASEDLAALAGAYSFFDRWAAQLRDRITELSA